MVRLIWQRYGLLLGLFVLALFKLWLVHTEEIYGSSTEYGRALVRRLGQALALGRAL